MKPAITSPIKKQLSPSGKHEQQPPKPIKGDIASCDQYARYMASKSSNYKATLSAIWVRFMNWSFLNDQTSNKQPYTGWKQQQMQINTLLGGEKS